MVTEFPWDELWERHKGKIVGSMMGLVLALLIRWIGVFWSLLAALFSVGGYFIGRQVDEGFENLESFIEQVRMRGYRQ